MPAATAAQVNRAALRLMLCRVKYLEAVAGHQYQHNGNLPDDDDLVVLAERAVLLVNGKPDRLLVDQLLGGV